MTMSSPAAEQEPRHRGAAGGLAHALFIVAFNRRRKRKRKRGEKNRLKRSQSESKQNSSFTSANDAASEGKEKLRAL